MQVTFRSLRLLPLVLFLLWPAHPVADDAQAPIELVTLPGGLFVMGDAEGEADEVIRQVRVAPFRMMLHEVTNRQFARFVDESGHQTDPERRRFGFVWDGRWSRVASADWRHPQGPHDHLQGKAAHPVVQVSAKDAAAFCAWYGLRLPSEEEWEFAARGFDRRRFPWGNALAGDGEQRPANFGTTACCAPDDRDGYRTTAPVGHFPQGASPFGLQDMAGNVWEWTSSPFPGRSAHTVLRGGGWGNNPYCLRTSYRHGNPPNIGLDMVGFRCAGDGA